MRLKLILEQIESSQEIPINYQYFLSSFIYRTIETSNNDYSKWLHDKGFLLGKKTFKFFTFSMLNIPERRIENNVIHVLSHRIDFVLSMLSLESMNNLIIGMFEKSRMKIKDADFRIRYAEKIPEPFYEDEMKFKTLSPVVISKRVEYDGKISERYMKPDEDDYPEYIKKNLEEKYLTYCSNFGIKVSDKGLESFELMNLEKQKLITIRAGTSSETRVKAFTMTFKLRGNPDIMRVGYEAGIGKLCSQGFGCVRVIS